MKRFQGMIWMWLGVLSLLQGQTVSISWPDNSTMPALCGIAGRVEAGGYFSTQGQEPSTQVRLWNADAAWRVHQSPLDQWSVGVGLRQEKIASILQNHQLTLGAAYRRALSGPRALFQQQLGAGIQMGLFQFNLQPSEWIFSSQFNDLTYHFDPGASSQEQLATQAWSSNLQPVIHGGLYYRVSSGHWSGVLVPSFSMLNAPVLDMDGWNYQIPTQFQCLAEVEYRFSELWTLGSTGWYTQISPLRDLQVQGYVRLGKGEQGETTFQLGGILGLNSDVSGTQFMHGGLQTKIQWMNHAVGLRLEDALDRINRWGTRILVQYRYVLPEDR